MKRSRQQTTQFLPPSKANSKSSVKHWFLVICRVEIASVLSEKPKEDLSGLRTKCKKKTALFCWKMQMMHLKMFPS